MRVLLVLCLGIAAACAARPAASRAQSASLRQVDWYAAIADDPNAIVDPTVTQLDDPVYGPYTTVDFMGMHVAGYPAAGSPHFGDIDGDGVAEAIIDVVSGGTAGETGVLVFHARVSGPRLAAILSGYKLGARIVDGSLIVTQAEYAGFEPNCCPSATSTTTYTLSGSGLAVLAQRLDPNPTEELTVQAFYEALDNRDYAGAYAFLSGAYQAAHLYDGFAAGYATTISITADTSPTANPNVVGLSLTAVDSTIAGATVTRHFRGTWTLVWDGARRRRALDRANIALAE